MQIPPKTAQLYTRQFALLPPKHFILCLCSAVNMNETQIAQNDFLEFEKMTEGVKQIKEALHKYWGPATRLSQA